MPVIAIVVGLAAGLAVWGVLEQIQSRQIKKIFHEELRSRLDLRSRESLIRFDQYLSSYAATTRLLANHRRLAEYLHPVFWSLDDDFEPALYLRNRPVWLSDFFERNALSPPSHVLLIDANGRTREVFQAGEEPLPAELAESVGNHLLDDREVRTVLTAFADRFYLSVSDAVEDSRGFNMGSLLVLVPVGNDFLAASQQGLSFDDAAIALVDSDEQRILVSVDAGTLLPDTPLSQWSEAYLITFTEALHVALSAHSGVRVQALVPGLTRTEFHTRLGLDPSRSRHRWMDPDAVVDASLRDLRRGKVVCVPNPRDGLLMRALSAMPRRAYYRVMDLFSRRLERKWRPRRP